MKTSNPTIEHLIVAENENYMVECSHIRTKRGDGINIGHHVCVLWAVENGKIVSGRHFFTHPGSVGLFQRSDRS